MEGPDGGPGAPAHAGVVAGGSGSRPPLPPSRPPGAAARPLHGAQIDRATFLTPLHSYVSEPPNSLAAMRDYAVELLAQQQQQQGQAAAAQLQSSQHPEQHGAIELPRLSAAATAQAFERPQHFDLAPHMLSPRRRTSTGVTAAGAGEAAATDAAPHMTGSAAPNPRLRTSIGWVTSRSPSSEKQASILEHRVAGDLIMPSRKPPPPPRAAHSARSPAKDGLRRRPILRPSGPSQGPGSPSPRGGARAEAAAGQGTSPAKKAEAGDDDVEKDDMESLDYDGVHKVWYRKRSFWTLAGPLLVSFVFILAGTLYITLNKTEKVSNFEIWRLCYFIAGIPIIWWIGRGTMNLAVWAVEKTMFTWQNALYYCYAVRRPMSNVIRAGLTTGWWALMMTSFADSLDNSLLRAYQIVLKLLGCLTLFVTADLLKVLFAKMLSSKFNQHAHFAKMHQALKREYLLHILLQPRQNYAELEGLEGEEEDDEEGGEDGEGDSMGRACSAPARMHRPQHQATIKRMFRRSGLFGSRRHDPPPLAETKQAQRSFKDKFMFWRSPSAKDLQSIEEEVDEAVAGGEGGEGSGHPGAKEAEHQYVPPGAVALDIAADGCRTTTDNRLTSSPESPLLATSPTTSAMLSAAAAPPFPSSPLGASKAAAANGQHATPHPSPSPVSKLVRHRSDALEALGLLHAAAQPHSPRGAPPASGSQTPCGRRSSGEQMHSGAGPFAADAEHGRQLPPVRVSAGAHSGEPSVHGGRSFSRGARATAGEGVLRRTASMQSMRSVRSQQTQQAQQAQQVDSAAAAKQRMLAHVGSDDSRRDSSAKSVSLMALKMSKMEKYIRKHALEVTFKDALNTMERSERVTSELEAKKLGFYLFHNVKSDFNREHIVLEDLEQFLDEKDAKAAMDMLDGDSNGQVNVQECCGAIAKVFIERRNLAASLKDARTIVGKLETVIGVVLHLFMGFLYLIIFNVDVMKTWAGFASLFLGFSFVFGNSIRTTYENVVFLFLVHPYDIGETLWLDNDQVKVEEIHLSFTVLMNTCNGRIWYPNEKIRIVPFINLTTSGNKGESFKVLVDLGTPNTVLDALKLAAEGVVKGNPKEFNGALSVSLREGGGPLKLTISVYWEFSHSGADVGRCTRNRTKMLAALSGALNTANVRYTWPATADGGHASSQAAAGSDAHAAAGTNMTMLL